MNRYSMRTKSFILSVILLLFTFTYAASQDIVESGNNGIFTFVDRMALTHSVPWNDLIKPLTRTQIRNALVALNNQKSTLSIADNAELKFYLREYSPSNFDSIKTSSYSAGLKVLKKDNWGRWRSLFAYDSTASIFIDPIVGQNVKLVDKDRLTEKNIGINLRGSFGSRIGYLFYFNDISFYGNGVKKIDPFSLDKKYVNIGDTSNHLSKNYNDLRFGLSYTFKKGNIAIGQDRFSWGYGTNTQIVLSQNAPAYPYIKLQVQPFKWLRFDYMHAWLQSNVIDSARSFSFDNTTFGGKRQYYIPKFYAFHSITYIPKNGIEISIGESIVYDSRLNLGYLIPISYFKSFDNTSNNQNLLAGANGQIFAGFSIRRLIPKTQLYGQIFVDEIRLTKAFSNNNRNQLGYQLGLKKAGLLGNSRFISGIEYNRNRPFIYANLNPAQNFTHHGQILGDWMGNNADRVLFYSRYTPIHKLYATLSVEYIRKGSAGSADDQYLANPQPPFMFGPLFKQKVVTFEMNYYLLQNITIRIQANWLNRSSQINESTQHLSSQSLGVLIGL